MKKFFVLFMSLVMIVAMATTAFAAETGSITINNTVKDTTYTIYRIFDLESYNSTSGTYAYKINSTWETFAESEAAKAYITVDAQGYVTWTGADTEEAYAAFAKLALENAPTSNDGTATADADNASVVFDNLPLGYYLVDTSLGALCGLTTTNPNATVIEKNAAPTVDKQVQEDSDSSWGDKDDADIGQTVNFQSIITVEGFAKNYVLHDTMSAGLTYGSVTGVTLNGTPVVSDNYTVTAPGTNGSTFDVAFTNTFCKTLKSGDKIVVSYNATVNENAVIGGEGNKNETYLEYGDNSTATHTTTPDVTKTYTWDMDIFKFTKSGDPATEQALAGATFTLSKNSNGATPIALISAGNSVYRVAKEGETGTVTEITTDDTGKFTIKGLDSDTYYLTETKAPDGYNKLTDPITIVIGSENGSTTVGSTVVEEVKVENKTGSELPSTGGIGTTIFYVVGGILMLGAAILLITKKMMSVSKD